MKIYTYHTQLESMPLRNETLEIWKSSWIKNGWEPIVLCEDDAKNHPLYLDFFSKIKSFPSVNAQGFDYHAFMRWLAVPSVGGIISTEPDVINYSLKPSDVEKYLDIANDGKLQCHSPVPAFLLGLPKSYENVCEKIIKHIVQSDDNVDGLPHLSDQDFSARYCDGQEVEFYRDSDICCELFDGDIFNKLSTSKWKNSPVVHFGTPYMATNGFLPKHLHINNLRHLDL
jgi:hypothetical protein